MSEPGHRMDGRHSGLTWSPCLMYGSGRQCAVMREAWVQRREEHRPGPFGGRGGAVRIDPEHACSFD